MRPQRLAKIKSKTKSAQDGAQQETDPVQVYCRVRPVEVGSGDGMCCKVVDDSTVQLTPGQMQYKFTRVFEQMTSQKAVFDYVAAPLVDDLLRGKNGLLFTYGITSSGKTYTMTGTAGDPGVLPRSLDMLFNSIQLQLAMKYVFKPDGCNGYNVQSLADAMLERQERDVIPCDSLRNPAASAATPKFRERYDLDARVRDESRVMDIDQDSSYAVFVSFVEVYNNSVFDLLEDVPCDPITGARPPSSKVLREDRKRIMYVHCVTEVEVMSTDEAFEVLYRGQKRRKVAHTVLNAESSRSHSVFTIRLVQAPLDQHGQETLQDKDKVLVSQLSLVDLAGSERTNRTKNCGDRLKEAGQINQSLMCLRSCIDILRDNQKSGGNKMVPYRDSKMTHLFRSYFDGEGKVRMVVCVNPKASESDEIVHVMKFAEATQEVQIVRQQQQRTEVPFAQGRRLLATDEALGLLPPFTGGGPYSLGPPFPAVELHSATDESILQPLQHYLEGLHDQRRLFSSDLSHKQDEFRQLLVAYAQDERQWTSQVDELHAATENLERRLSTAERDKERMQRKLAAAEALADQRGAELARCERDLAQEREERERLKADYRNKFSVANHEHERQLEREKQKLQQEANERVSLKDRKLRLLKNIVNTPSDAESLAGELAAPSGPRYASARQASSRAAMATTRVPDADGGRLATPLAPLATPQARPRPPFNTNTLASSMPRLRARSPPPPVSAKPAASILRNHRRSKSADGDRWLDHKPSDTVDIDTVLQPNIKKKRSVSKLDIKDTKDTNKYLLTHQEADAKGVLETRLIKGQVIPTAGGGSSVVFTDVETLKQTSPGDRKRRVVQAQPGDYDGEWTDTEDRCKVAIEGHGFLKKIRGEML